jgi:hypothetical protein
MKTLDQSATKWNDSTSQGEQTWVDNLNNTQKPIVSAAIAARSRMQAAFAASTQPGGPWERHLSDVGDAGIKQAATAKRSNYTTGVSQAQPKFRAALAKILAYEAQGLQTVAQMKANGQSGKAVMNYWFDYMSAGRGQLSAQA